MKESTDDSSKKMKHALFSSHQRHIVRVQIRKKQISPPNCHGEEGDN
jgi:hypothetical protein